MKASSSSNGPVGCRAWNNRATPRLATTIHTVLFMTRSQEISPGMPDGQSRALGEGIERRRHRRGIWRISSYASSEREPWQWLRIVIAMATARGNRGVAQAVRTALEHVPPTEGWMGKAPPVGVHFWRRTCRDQAADALCR